LSSVHYARLADRIRTPERPILLTRSRVVTTAVLGVAVAITGGAATAMAAPATTVAHSHVSPTGPAWSQTDSNAAGSRANGHERTLRARTVAGLVRQHRYLAPVDTAGDCGAVGNSAPILTAGHVIEVSNDVLLTYDAETSKRLWSATLDASKTTIYNSVAVANGIVVVAGEDCESFSDPNGIEQAFNATNGHLMWHGFTSPFGGALQHMVVSGNFVVAVGDSEGSGSIVSVNNLLTGADVWFHPFGECGESSNLAVVDGKVIYSHCDADGSNPVLEADDLATGTLDWSRVGTWSVERGDTDALTSRHLLVVGPQGALVDLAPQTGATRRHLQGATHALVVGRSRVFTTCNSSQICAYKLGDHSLLWSVSDPSSLAAEAGGVLYLADGKMLRVGTGSLIATIGRHSQSSSLVVGNGRMARTHDERSLLVYALPGL
jgi:outer membrane protein assembly factor BamB